MQALVEFIYDCPACGVEGPHRFDGEETACLTCGTPREVEPELIASVLDIKLCDWRRETLPANHTCRLEEPACESRTHLDRCGECPSCLVLARVQAAPPVVAMADCRWDWTLDELAELAEREPAEPEQEPPLDLDAIEDSIRTYYAGSDDDSAKAAEDLVTVMSGLVAELRAARQRIAALEALPTREEWAVTDNDSTPPRAALGGYHLTPEVAMRMAAEHGVQAWRRVVTTKPVVVHPWEPIANKSPF